VALTASLTGWLNLAKPFCLPTAWMQTYIGTAPRGSTPMACNPGLGDSARRTGFAVPITGIATGGTPAF